MARTSRDLQSSTILHVSNRGNDRQDIFSLDADWHLFEENLAAGCERHGVAVLVNAWMTNHFHMIVECDDVAQLPEMMREFQASYARSYNLRTGRTGSLFERAFFSRPVIDDGDLLQTARYVHLNPVDIVGERALPTYRWSSLGVYLGRRRPEPWLATQRLESLVEPDRYLDELRRPHRWDQLPLGSWAPRRSTTLEDVIAAVHEHRLAQPSGSRDHLICHIALRSRAATDQEIADRLGVDPSTVRRRARRMRVRVSTEPSFALLCDAVLDSIARAQTRLGSSGG